MSNIVKNLDRTEIENMIFAETGIAKELTYQVLSSFFRNLGNGVALKEYAEVYEFGSFRLKRLAPLNGKLPDGTPFDVGERITVEFNPGPEVRAAVEAVTGLKCIL